MHNHPVSCQLKTLEEPTPLVYPCWSVLEIAMVCRWFVTLLLLLIANTSVVQGLLGPQLNQQRRPNSCLYEVQSSLLSVRDVPEEEGEKKMILYHVDFKNFWRQTRGHFIPCERPKNRSPDYKSNNSWYWDVDDEYVVRSSDHWSNGCGSIKDCFWTIDEETYRAKKTDKKKRWLTGKCSYADLERGKKSSMRMRINDRKVE